MSDTPDYTELSKLLRAAAEGERVGRAPIRKAGAIRPSTWEPGSSKLSTIKGTLTPYTPLHHALVMSRAFRSLNLSAVQVLLFLMTKFKFKFRNNDKLVVTLRELQAAFGWKKSPNTLAIALRTLQIRKFIQQTRKRKGSEPAAWALTWLNGGRK